LVLLMLGLVIRQLVLEAHKFLMVLFYQLEDQLNLMAVFVIFTILLEILDQFLLLLVLG